MESFDVGETFEKGMNSNSTLIKEDITTLDKLKNDLKEATEIANDLKIDNEEKKTCIVIAEKRINSLVENRKFLEGKLMTYSSTLRKMIKEKEELN
jgi:hypothetical protein